MPNVDFKDTGFERVDFRSDILRKSRFFGGTSSSKLEAIYSKNHQIEMAESLYGTDQEYFDISSSSTMYFAKGHLTPFASFVYEAEQQATEFYFNVAPQFQSFNNGNWKAIETKTTDLAIRY